MTLFVFCLVVSLLALSAALCGDVSTFYNLDSVLIVLAGFALSSLVMARGRAPLFWKGLKDMVSFRRGDPSDPAVARLFGGVAVMTLTVSVGSTAQGLICAAFIGSPYTPAQNVALASFTSVYGLLLVGLLLVPVIERNR